jgi:geranylgeranyl transferase type-2 subunit alpha
MLSLDSRNFHGWGYRRTVIAALESNGLDQGKPGVTDVAGQSLVEEEFTYTTKMIETNLSNFSAWHNRSKLIQGCWMNEKRTSPRGNIFWMMVCTAAI